MEGKREGEWRSAAVFMEGGTDNKKAKKQKQKNTLYVSCLCVMIKKVTKKTFSTLLIFHISPSICYFYALSPKYA